MKTIFKSLIFATVFLFPVLFFNCAEEQIPATAQFSLIRQYLQLQTTSASFGYNSNLTQTISVTGENTPWTLTGLPDWLTASATTGNGAATITLTAKENTSVDEARAAVLTFASSASDYQYSKTISVSQPVATIYITPSEGTVSFMPKGESKTVGITSNVDWTATCTDTHFTVEKVNSTQLRVTAKENVEAKTQTATIQLMRSGTTTTITTISVTQAEAGVTGSTDNISFAVDGETKTTAITADATWTATVSDDSWLTVTPAGGSNGTVTLTIKAEANTSDGARSGFVYVRIGSTTKLAIPVSQEGIKFTVSASTLTLKSTTEATTLNVTANAAWKVISKPEWLNATLPETLVGTNALILTPQDNPNTTPRTGQLVIGRDGFSGNQTITVTQEGKTFGDLTAQMDFPVTAATQTLSIETDGVWTAATATSWIHLSPTGGQGRGTLQVSVDANPGKNERTGSLTVTVGQTTQTVAVRQVGRYIILSCDDIITNSTPTSVRLSVSSNMSWTAASNVDWMTVEPKLGEGDAALTISVADNPSLSERTGTIIVQSGEVTQAFSFTQPGRTLSLSIDMEKPITFTHEGGTSQVITVITDGTYTITSSDAWLAINESGNTFTVTATQNDGAARTATVTVALTGLLTGESKQATVSVLQAKYVAPDPLGLCPDNDHPHAIDMGLTVNGKAVKFACCNVGAETETNPQVEYGDYFAWGETSGYNSGKTTFSWSTYKWCNGSSKTMTKYCNDSSYGTVDNKKQLELSDDAARANWGGLWRMPTIDELSALTNTNNFTWTWTTIGGTNGYKNGYKVTSYSTNNSIFLPAAGYRDETSLYYDGSRGRYLSSSLYESNAVHYLRFQKSSHDTYGNDYRYYGRSVRPVTE